MRDGLLEELTERMRMPYLSDLRLAGCRKALVKKLGEIHAEDYSLTDWSDAVHYLLKDTERVFQDSEAARAFLIDQLQK